MVNKPSLASPIWDVIIMINNYAIIGTGAIGGYCAIRLTQAGFAVHCLMRSDFQHVQQHGLSLLSDQDKTTVAINAYQTVDDMPVCDVILVALKTTQNTLLKELLPKIMHKNTKIVLLQNGIGMEQELAEFIDPNNIIGGICMLKVTKIAPGVIRHYGLDSIELAQYYSDAKQQGITEIIEELAENFRKAKIGSTAAAHLATIRWKKLGSNIATSGLAVVLDAYAGDLIRQPASFKLICDITQEVIAAAKKCGAQLPDDFYQYRLNILKKIASMEKNYSSMKDDFNAKNPLELHAIYENAINVAKQHGAAMPLTEMLYQQLQYLNEKNLLNP